MSKVFLISVLVSAITIFVAFIHISVGQVFAEDSRSPELYSGLLVPTADPAPGVDLGISMLSFPASAIGHLAFPLFSRATVILDGGLSGYPVGFGGSVALRLHLRKPNAEHWGFAVQAQSALGVLFSGGEGGGGFVNALELVVSSPIKATRIHFGGALHTMPGSEYEPGWEEAKEYDFKNPQTSTFISWEHKGKRAGIFTEIIWMAVGADDGWDSALVGLIGGKFTLGRTNLKLGTGILIEKFGSGRFRILPAPPVVSLVSTF